jgi:1-acyl-sn-glycerol-3-phosphate acyltransferase
LTGIAIARIASGYRGSGERSAGTTIARRRRRGEALEPWFALAKAVLLPPLKLWFNWHLEGIERVPREGPAIVVGNHLSYFDPLAHGYFVVRADRRPRFLAKQELFENRVLRTALLGLRQVPVRRGTGDQQPLEDATRALERGEVMVIYPEGTSLTDRPDFAPGRGKTGALRLALATEAPVLPVATWGGQYVWRRGERRHFTFGRPIWLKAGEPFDLPGSAGSDDPDRVRTLTDRLMEELAALVADLRSRYPTRWS